MATILVCSEINSLHRRSHTFIYTIPKHTNPPLTDFNLNFSINYCLLYFPNSDQFPFKSKSHLFAIFFFVHIEIRTQFTADNHQKPKTLSVCFNQIISKSRSWLYYVTDISEQIAGISVRKTQRAVSRTNEHRTDNYEASLFVFCLASTKQIRVCLTKCPILTTKTTIDSANKDPSDGYVIEILKLFGRLTFAKWKDGKYVKEKVGWFN